ncbi:uncharacterized protein LOC131882680 isoform X2 [Tigriopus californicus]|nr:uncharacterized protein LOC131882680 isoform X2 [Tigriopus californicus]|eukprot:TCALIF_09865-PA protein Name:"Protein of unknown function" AED:0.05 eAED:0.05 QI:0/-1/0/1/-1/1/1/0/620
MFDHTYAEPLPAATGSPSTEPSVTIKTEMTEQVFLDIKPDMRTLQPSPKLSAVEVELQMLGPIWYEAISDVNQGASDAQIKTLLDLKLEQAKGMIPVRWKAEKKFKDDCLMIEQISSNLDSVLKNLQAKDLNDPSVKIEDHQAKRLITDWETTRYPAFEANFQEATRTWYKPDRDPLTTSFSAVMNNFANLMARFEYETSIRPVLNGSSHRQLNDPSDSQIAMAKDMVTMEDFQVRDKITRFEGDLSDSEVMAKFAKWRKDWECLVKEMEGLPGFSKIALFRKLKKAVSNRALRTIYRFSSQRQDSYDNAMKELNNRFENPMNIAAYHIKRGLTKRPSNLVQLEAAQEALNALQGVKEVFQTQKVDMFYFALTCAFTKSMAPHLESKWDQFKVQEMHDYNSKRDSALKAGENLPEWHFGMVDNYEQFNAWLRLQGAQLKQPKIEPTGDKSGDHHRPAKEPLTDMSCFLCGPDSNTHHLTRCPRGLAMSMQEWKRACRRLSYCHKCGRPSSRDHHRCDIKCRICMGRRSEVNHHVLMCPLSNFRTSPLYDEDNVSTRISRQEISYRNRSEATPGSPDQTRSRSSYRRDSVHSSDGEHTSYYRSRQRSPLRSSSSSGSRYHN